VAGTVTATAFQGNGAGLTNVSGTDSTKVAKTGDTMTGALTLLGNPTAPLHAAPKQYVDAHANAVNPHSGSVAKTGDTMTGALRISDGNTLELGAGVIGKEVNAGKIGYGTFDSAALCIVGAGTSAPVRKIHMWAEGGATVEGPLTVSGGITVGGNISLAAGKQLSSLGRMHIAGEEILYLLNKSGVIVGKEWGGTGNLTVEGAVSVGDNIAVNGAWVMVNGAGGEKAYLGGDGVGNDVQVGSQKKGVTSVSFWNWADGWMYAAGKGFRNFSDARHKDHIENIPDALNKVMQLRGVMYNWKDEASKYPEGRQLGFLAQEVQEVLPEAVSMDARGFYSLTYNSIIPVLVEAMKEQQAAIEVLKKKIENK